MMKKSLKALFFLVTVSGTPPALAVDLFDIYRDAQLNDARFGAAKAQYQAQQERLPQARAGLLPNINFDANYNYNDIDIEYTSAAFNSGRRNYDAYEYGVNLIQPIYRRQNMLAFTDDAGTRFHLVLSTPFGERTPAVRDVVVPLMTSLDVGSGVQVAGVR